MMHAENLNNTESSLTLFDDPVQFFSILDSSTLQLYAMRKQPAIDGAMGRNKAGFDGIQHQCAALDFIIYGVVTKQRRCVEAGLRALAYGFRYQNQDGSFTMVDTTPEDGGELTQATQFVANAAMAIVMLTNSGMHRRYLKPLAEFRAGIAHTMNWLYPQHQSLLYEDRYAGHRLLFDALAFCLSAQILESKLLQQKGWLFQTVPLLLKPLEPVGSDDSVLRNTDLGTETLLLLYFLIFVRNPVFENEILETLVPVVERLKSLLLDADTRNNGEERDEVGMAGNNTLCNINVVKSLWLYATISGDQDSWRAGNEIKQTLTLQSRRQVAMLNGTAFNDPTL